MNADWHRKNRMPRRATLSQRIAWHLAHTEACACRPIPPNLAAVIAAENIGDAKSASVVRPRAKRPNAATKRGKSR